MSNENSRAGIGIGSGCGKHGFYATCTGTERLGSGSTLESFGRGVQPEGEGPGISHFTTGRTGRSTVRWSFAVLLREQLGPRNPTPQQEATGHTRLHQLRPNTRRRASSNQVDARPSHVLRLANAHRLATRRHDPSRSEHPSRLGPTREPPRSPEPLNQNRQRTKNPRCRSTRPRRRRAFLRRSSAHAASVRGTELSLTT